VPIAWKQVSALETRPALVAIMIATVLFLDYRCHRLPPRPKPLPCAKWRAKDGEVAPWLQSFSVASQVFSRSPSRRDGRRGDQGLREHVQSRQKTVRSRPIDQLPDALSGSLWGATTIAQHNRTIRTDRAVQRACGHAGCAEQSTMARTLRACTVTKCNAACRGILVLSATLWG